MAINASTISNLADDFSKRWLSELDKSKQIYGEAEAGVKQIGVLADQLGAEYDSYMERWSPIRDQLMTAGVDDLEKRNQLAEQFMSLATPDYQGSMGRAMADVAHQGDLAKGQIARDLSRRGVQLGAGQYSEILRKNALDTAKAKALAAGMARSDEQKRVAGMATTGMQLFDPSNTLGLAQGVEKAGNDLITQQANLTGAGATLATQLGTNYAQNIAEPMGDAAGAYQGMALAASEKQKNDNQPWLKIYDANWNLKKKVY